MEDFVTWLEEKKKGMKTYSGIGKDNYTKYQKEVHLVPYSWEEQVLLVERELKRSLTALAFEEHRNLNLPPLQPAGSLKEMQERKKKTVEELMMQAGIVKDNPRARELFHIMLAFRAIRALGELKLHSGEWTLLEAIDFAVEKIPMGWITHESNTIHGDYAIYLTQPGYGTSYVIGKLQLDRLIADRKDQLGEAFVMKDFFDEYFSRGVIPASLSRWEMTGDNILSN